MAAAVRDARPVEPERQVQLGGIGGAYSWGLDGTHVVFTPSSYALIYAGFMDERPTVPSATATPGLGTYARGFQVGLGLG